MDSEAHSFYRPVTKVHAYSDIGLDLGLHGNMSQVEQHAIRLPDKEYRELIQKLNTKQQEIFTYIIQWIKSKDKESLNLFLTGGAGVGKSVVITALYQTLHRCVAQRVKILKK